MTLPPLPTQAEAAAAVYGTWRLLLGDRSGLTYFASGAEGFWRSCWVLAAVVPLNLMIFIARVLGESGPELTVFGLAQLALAVSVAWFGYALVVHYALPALDREKQYFDYMIPEFWSSLPIIVLQFTVIAMAEIGLLPGALGKLLTVATLGTELWLRAQIIRLTLDQSYGMSTALVVAGLVFHAIVAAIFTRGL